MRRRRHRRSRRHLIGRWCSHTPHTVIVTPVINFETIQFDLNENSPSAFGRLVVKSTESNKSAQRSVTLVRNHTAHFLTFFVPKQSGTHSFGTWTERGGRQEQAAGPSGSSRMSGRGSTGPFFLAAKRRTVDQWEDNDHLPNRPPMTPPPNGRPLTPTAKLTNRISNWNKKVKPRHPPVPTFPQSLPLIIDF